jgi:hypothetical protein
MVRRSLIWVQFPAESLMMMGASDIPEGSLEILTQPPHAAETRVRDQQTVGAGPMSPP